MPAPRSRSRGQAVAWALAATLTAVLAAAPAAGIACGVCIDDKVAAVYDHAVVTQAMDSGKAIVFCEVAGPREARLLAPPARRAAQALRGVDRGSVRTSDELPVVSFVLDPATQSPQAAVDRLRQALAGDGITPTLLKVLQKDAPR